MKKFAIDATGGAAASSRFRGNKTVFVSVLLYPLLHDDYKNNVVVSPLRSYGLLNAAFVFVALFVRIASFPAKDICY